MVQTVQQMELAAEVVPVAMPGITAEPTVDNESVDQLPGGDDAYDISCIDCHTGGP